MKTSIFEYSDYKKYIEDYVQALGEPWGYWGKLANAISCQPAYLSRCLKDKTHLTVDQILALSRFWSLSNQETEYLIFLLEMARAGTEENRKYFLAKTVQIRKENEDLKKQVRRESLKQEDQILYYSNWLWMAIHFATSIKQFQTVSALSQRFNVSTSQVIFILEKLLALGLIVKNGDHWIFHSGEFHLPKQSPLISTHHQNWRTRAIMDAQYPNTDGIHYSAVYTLSEKDFAKLKSQILDWIKTSDSIVAKSKEEEVCCLNLDLFRL
ncbi:MAG: TIGR02147 family protein [Bdellovibrio sp.]